MIRIQLYYEKQIILERENNKNVKIELCKQYITLVNTKLSMMDNMRRRQDNEIQLKYNLSIKSIVKQHDH